MSKSHIPIHPKHHAMSFGVFIAILTGLFFLFTIVYPKIVLQSEIPNTAPGQPDTIVLQQPVSPPPPVDTVSQLAPFVRGIISGSKSAVTFSKQESKGISITDVQGYQHGAKTAILTSLNWFDLDRELFQSAGLHQGVINAVAQSKQNPLQFQLGYQVQLTRQIRNALETNIETLLDGSNNRLVTFKQFVSELKTLQDQGQLELAQLSRQLAQYKVDWESALNQQDAASSQFKQNIQQSMVEDLDQNIADFQNSGSEAVKLRAQHNAYLTIFSNLQPLVNRLPIVIAALEANAEALVAGIKVAPSNSVNLPLFQN
jgi:hypothetical protein